MKKILFPTDFSSAAVHAYAYAQALAAEMGAVIDSLHIYHAPVIDATGVPPEYIQEMLEQAEENSRKKLDRFIHDYRDRQTCGACRPVYGLFTSTEITALAKEDGYDLIIMGTKGERGSLEKLMGSVTTDVMMKAPCPVLAIPENATYRSIEHIAYATDFEPRDSQAVEQLMDIAAKVKAKVHFVHVNTQSDHKNIEDIKSQKTGSYSFTDFSVVNFPTVLEGLEHYIQDRQVDWLALFIPRRRLWEWLFHSSFTKKMTFHSHVPLLVFHE